MLSSARVCISHPHPHPITYTPYSHPLTHIPLLTSPHSHYLTHIPSPNACDQCNFPPVKLLTHIYTFTHTDTQTQIHNTHTYPPYTHTHIHTQADKSRIYVNPEVNFRVGDTQVLSKAWLLVWISHISYLVWLCCKIEKITWICVLSPFSSFLCS